jgi:glyoxylase-like metal-dependent hydrolase (beta-lactamase superfamily II)
MRIALKSLVVLAALVLAAAAFVLVPAHLQVRNVSPALPDRDELRQLLTRSDGPVALRYVNTSTQRLPKTELGHTVFLLEWANGNLFMIDAGMDEPTAIEFGELLETIAGAEPAAFHGTVAEFLGTDVARVTGVGFTHLHIDHAQGVVPLCAVTGSGARLYRTEWQASLHNFNTEQGAELIADSCLDAVTLKGEGLLEIEGFPGLGIAGLGGHTPGSTMFAAAVNGRLWLFSGDTTNSKADLLSDTGKGFLYSYLMVPEDTARTRELRRWFASLDAEADMQVVVSHDLADIEASDLRRWPTP